MTKDPFRLKSPCPHCPFRKDIPAFLRKDRVRELRENLPEQSFTCHKTIQYSDDEGEPMQGTGMEALCAGSLILMEKLGEQWRPAQLGERLGLYDRSKLDMAAPVFENWDEMEKAQER
jgi:hypothetical protein